MTTPTIWLAAAAAAAETEFRTNVRPTPTMMHPSPSLFKASIKKAPKAPNPISPFGLH